MKVLLFAPPYPIEEYPSPPLGLCYAAAAFEAAGCTVKIVDFIVSQFLPDKIIEEIKMFQPDIVGTNSVTMNHNSAVSILKTAKSADPNIVTMMGGPHISFDYEDTLRQNSEIDVAVIGEGEKTISELVPTVHNRKKWSGINGLAFLEGMDLIKTPKREFISDLDSLPLPARHLLPISKYLALGLPASLITSRGCPNQCIFCVGNKMVGHKFRTRNVQNILDEIQDLVNIGFEQINFADDFFTVNKKRVKAICAEIKTRKLKFGWAIFARADSVDRNILQVMKDAGCHTVLFGIESGNQEMLDRINKRIKIDQIRNAVALCKDVGMQVFGSFIVGLPGETHDTLMDSHRLSQELGVLYGYHFLSPFPGTILKEKMDQYDLQLLSSDWSKFDANHAIVQTSALSPDQIAEFVEIYYNKKNQADDEDRARRYKAGLCSDVEKLIIEGNQKMEVVSAILSKDIIETSAALDKSDVCDTHTLASYVAQRIAKNKDAVRRSIKFLVERGYLTGEETNGQTKWSWI